MFAIDLEERGAIQDVWIYNNYIKNHNTGIQFDIVANATQKTYLSGTTLRCERVYIYNNIIENPGNTTNNYARGVRIVPEGSLSSNPIVWDQIYIDNNTIIGGLANNMYAGVMVQTGGTMSNIYVRNNIIERANNNPVVFYYNLAGTQTNFNVNKNLYYLNVHNTIGYINVTPTITGTDVTPANPLFVSSTDFHLTTGSPAIDAGIHITTPSISTDYDGVNIGNPPEIGAYEFISNHPPSIQDQGFQLNENSPDGTAVGIVVASDPDAGQTLTYSIVSGNTNGAFSINASTGVLSVANGATLTVDFSLVVKVQDNGVGELNSQATIAINVIPTGIEITENNSTIKVYPNPVSYELIIEMKGNNDSPEFEILNSLGQTVFKGKLSEKTVVQTTNFAPGVYIIKLENGSFFEYKKIIKV